MVTYFDPFRELDRVATRVAARAELRMPADIFRDDDHYVLSVELPGVDPGSIDVNVDGQQLTIRAERTQHSDEGVTWIARERATGAVERSFTLGRMVDTAGITADYDSGVLSLVIPVSEQAKPRRIEVGTGAPREAVTV